MGRRPSIDVSSLRRLRKLRESLGAFEPFSYNEALSSVMVSPVFTSVPGARVKDVVEEMSARGFRASSWWTARAGR